MAREGVLVAVAAAVLAASLVGASAMPQAPLRHHARTIHRMVMHAREERVREVVGEKDPPATQWITQPLDHFDATNDNTYQQRYYVNDTLWKAGNMKGPVFLYIGGEGAQSPYAIMDGHMVKMAEEHNALMFAVEHRTYGASVIGPDLTTPNLAHLSSQQALADLAAFHAFAVGNWQLGDAPWVCFGGSYPGALSAFFRLKYPHIVTAAVASSAPVLAQLDFQGYHDVVAASLAAPVVGGSAQCAANIKSAFATIGQCVADPAKRQQLARDFNSCGSLDADNDAMTFQANLADIFDGVVQYNNELPGINIEAICKTMTNASMDPVSNLKALNAAMLAQGNQKCLDNSYADSIAPVLNTTVDPTATGVGIRQWTWQTCSQFAYFQTCEEGTDCLFYPNEGISLKAQLDLCNTAFGVAPASVGARVNFTNEYYGGDKTAGSRILFVNGSIDPWHFLSVLKAMGDDEQAIFIDGTAHCANMGSDKASDTKALTDARAQIAKQVTAWLADA